MQIEVNIDTKRMETIISEIALIVQTNNLTAEVKNSKITIDLSSLIDPEIIITNNNNRNSQIYRTERNEE